MPYKEEREYRAMPVMAAADEEKLIDSDYYVQGYATTFGDQYLLWEDNAGKFYEVIDRNAFDEADTMDVIFLRNHTGKCLARTKMKAGVAPTLILQTRENGLYVGADLGMTAEGRDEYAAISGGLVYQMSFAFTVADDDITEIGEKTYLRTIKRIKKVYDVSSVDMPANPSTFIDISARSAFEGYIESRKQELFAREQRERQKQKIKILTEVY